MDLSAFGDQNFNAKEWINNAFKTSEAVANKDAFTASLVMKLQLFIQEVNNSLEETSQQILHSLPRVVKDAGGIAQEAAQLQEQMRAVQEDIAKVERNTAESMQTLMRIDTIKSRMQAANKALQEADNWTTLSADVEEVFQSGDVNAIAAKLVGMQHSLEILVDVPDYKQRVQHLDNLKNRLEALLSPQLIAAFNTQPIDAAQMYVRIFREIQRLPELEKYYHKCRKSQLLNQWKAIVEQDPDESLEDWLNNFYDTLLSTWHTQMKWCNQVFLEISPVEILCNILSDTLNAMDPSLSFCIEAALKQQKNPLQYLIDLKQISERFSKSLEGAILSYGVNITNSQAVSTLIDAIFFPYRYHIQKYQQYEENLLLSQLNRIKTGSNDIMDAICNLGDSVSKIFALLSQASDRCNLFTNSCMYFGLIEAYKVFFSTYFNRFNQVVDQMKDSYSVNSENTSAILCEDWSLPQHILNIIQITGDLYNHLENLDQQIISNQINAAKKGGYYQKLDEKQEINPFHKHHLILLNSTDQNRLRQFISGLQCEHDPSALLPIKEMAQRQCDTTVKTTFDLIFSQIQNYLAPLPTMKVWSEEDTSGILAHGLPTYSISPLEYITQIGQYLMTLPQHIEPFTLQDNQALKTAFKFSKIVRSTEQTFQPSEDLADCILHWIALGILDIYMKSILKINKLNPSASKQLAADIEYLFNVLDDLGLKATVNMQHLLALLKASPSDYPVVADGKPGHLVKTIGRMKGYRMFK